MTRFFLLKITLKETPTPVWRQVVIPAHIPLNFLHLAIQQIMGWENREDYMFKAGGIRYVTGETPNEYYRSADQFWLCDVGRNRAKFKYIYNLQYDWVHEVLVESTDYPNPDRSYPIRCLDGAGACPPEDCEGAWGFYNLCETLADPKHPEFRDMKKRYGKFDPSRFNRAAINRSFKITPKERSEPPKEPGESPGMAALYREMRKAMEAADRKIFGKTMPQFSESPEEKVPKKATKKSVKKKAFKIIPKGRSDPPKEPDKSPNLAAMRRALLKASKPIYDKIFGETKPKSPKSPVKKTSKKATKKLVKKKAT